MQAHIQKWGNSLALRIPKSFAAETQLAQGTLVDITFQDGRIVVVPLSSEPSLEEMLAAITPENRHAQQEIGEAMGIESWE